MKTVLCSYAYDVPHYYDFVVEVGDNVSDNAAEVHAEKMAKKALREGLFDDQVGRECIENECNHRVFVSGPASKSVEGVSDGDPLLERLAVPVKKGKKEITLHLREK